MTLNLTQHAATPEQVAAGVHDLPEAERAALVALLTFDSLPGRAEIEARAHALAELACCNGLAGDEGDDPHPAKAMIGGAPYLMAALEAELRARHIEPVYAFSVRESVEQTQPDGSVRKINVFRHTGWVSA
jgi:hypothetical protein